MQDNRAPGVSFIVRARNEESNIEKAITSLDPLTIPHEIVVILHRCTDGSKAIVERLLATPKEDGTIRNICIYEVSQPLSRAGYENLVTPHTHPASFCNFTLSAYKHARYSWIFKWDSDFSASEELINFLNTRLVLDEPKAVRYNIPCMVGTLPNYEFYLCNCILSITKYVFWEVSYFVAGAEERKLENEKIYTLPHTVLKEYWKEPRWFEKDPLYQGLEAKYQILCNLFGPEQVGACRAQNPDCDKAFYAIQNAGKDLERFGIYLRH